MQPSPSLARSSASPPPTATEIVTRPEPGLARGKWEAPPWVFWTALALVLIASTAYLLARLGLLRLRPRNAEAKTPPSTRAPRP